MLTSGATPGKGEAGSGMEFCVLPAGPLPPASPPPHHRQEEAQGILHLRATPEAREPLG